MEHKISTYDELMSTLDKLGLFHMDLTLERMREFAQRLGPTGFTVFQVVGTNGKGSTATILAELLRCHGLSTGLYLSPHFVTVRERILVNGHMLPEEDWARLGAQALELSHDLGLTYFELLTAIAMLAFREAGVSVAVLEAGLGGRYDAVNVFDPVMTVFTPIGMDHMNILGDTLELIAADKAGAMRAGGLAVSAEQEPVAWEVLARTAADVGCELVPGHEVLYYHRANGRLNVGPAKRGVVRAMTGLWLNMLGQHQEDNARTALAAFHIWAKRLKLPVNENACREALAAAFIPGRMQRVPRHGDLPELILDGGHNAHGLAALCRAIEQDETLRPSAVVFGCLRDKPLADMLPLVHELTGAAKLVAVGIPSCPRALLPEELAKLLGPETLSASDIHVALEQLSNVDGPVLVCGSLYLLGEFYTTHPWALERA